MEEKKENLPLEQESSDKKIQKAAKKQGDALEDLGIVALNAFKKAKEGSEFKEKE